MPFFQELRQRKVVRVGVAYLVAAWLAVQVADIALPAFDAPQWTMRVIILLFALGFPIALVLAWALELTSEGVKLDMGARDGKLLVAIAVILTALALGWYFHGDLLPRTGQTLAHPTSAAPAQRNPQAYDLYIHGKVKAASDNPRDLEEAIDKLERAVALDPNYAEAWAELAYAYWVKAAYYASQAERQRLNDDAEVAVEKALALNPNLAMGHFARGIVLWTHVNRYPHAQALQAFRRAVELDPQLDDAHLWLALVLMHVGLLDEAQQEIDTTLRINPNNTLARFRIALIDEFHGKYEDAWDALKTVPEDASPSLVSRAKADVLVRLNRLDEAQVVIDQYLETWPEDQGGNVTSVQAVLYALRGRNAEAETAIQRAIRIGRNFGHFHHTAYNIAVAYALMHQPDKAMKWLQTAADDGFPCFSFFAVDHYLDSLRSDPRFVAFMARGKAQMEKYRTP